jgi:proline dehydrogenase
MWSRSVLLFFGRQRWLRNLVETVPVGRGMVKRFVAGETLGEALAVCRALEAEGMTATLDHLGENVTNLAEAEASLADYLAAWEGIKKGGLSADTSLKLTQFGLDLSTEACIGLVMRLAEVAKAAGRRIEIDMESSAYTDRTLAVVEAVHKRFGNVRAVVQAYLYRSEKDVEHLCAQGVPVRLCKGAYLEPGEKAFPDKAAVDANYVKLMRYLVQNGTEPAIATHDEAMIQAAKLAVAQRGLAPRGLSSMDERQGYEFQLLYGVRRDLQQQLARQGHRVRVYVPYGREWYPYFMRRLAERPANVWFLLKNAWRN